MISIKFLGCYSLWASNIQFSSNRSISHFKGLFLLAFWRKNWAILQKLGGTSFLTQISPNFGYVILGAMPKNGQSGRMFRQLWLNRVHSSMYQSIFSIDFHLLPYEKEGSSLLCKQQDLYLNSITISVSDAGSFLH